MEDLQKYVEDYKYLLINHDGSHFIHNSLRKMAGILSVDHTTISKKLKEAGHCYCMNKDTKKPVYILKL